MKPWLFQNGNFILTVTRFAPEKEQKKKIQAKRKTAKLSNNITVYQFNSFDEFDEFCKYIKNNISEKAIKALKSTSLYLYNSKYYLTIKLNKVNLDSFKSIHYAIVEFATYTNNSDLFERKLTEYGKAIFKSNAINNYMKFI